MTRTAALDPRATPEASAIIGDIRTAIDAARALGVFEKLVRCHELRRCIWAGQHPDGLKHGADAFPYDRAADCKARIADPIIADNVRLRMSAVRAGRVLIGPQNAVEDSVKAQQWDGVLRALTAPKKGQTSKALKAFFTSVEEFGYGIMKVRWAEEFQLLPHTVTEDDLSSMLASATVAAQSATAQAQGYQLEDAAMAQMEEEALIQAKEVVLRARIDNNLEDLTQSVRGWDPQASDNEAKRAAKGIIKTGSGQYYASRSVGGKPEAKAYFPWVNVLHSTDLQEDRPARWFAEPELLNETELRLRRVDWDITDEDFESILKAPFEHSATLGLGDELDTSWLLNGVGIGFSMQVNADYPLYQIFTVTRTAIDENGVPAIFETTVSGACSKVLKNVMLATPRMPYIVEQRESATLTVQSRGIPELVDTDQVAFKKLLDGTVAAAELASWPPNVQTGKDPTKPKPGAVFTEGRQSGNAGGETRFLQVPGVDAGALEVMRFLQSQVDTRFHRGPSADREGRRLYNEELGAAAIMTYEELTRLFWALIQTHVDAVTASRIAGRPVSVQASQADLAGDADITIEHSPLSLNQEDALKMLDVVTKAAALSGASNMDANAAFNIVLRTFDASLAEAVMLTPEVASQRVADQEQGDLSILASGQLAAIRKGNEKERLELIQAWMANPDIADSLREGSVLAERLEARIQAYQFAMTQQQNAVIGATGYDPSSDPVLGTK